MTKTITIRIRPETRDRLKDLGTLRDTYDSLINRALDCIDPNKVAF